MSTNAKTAVITGAGSGIGFAVAEAFVREGTNVVLNGRTEDKLTRAAARVSFSSFRPLRTTFAPCKTKASATAKPMPLPAPVMTTVFVFVLI